MNKLDNESGFGTVESIVIIIIVVIIGFVGWFVYKSNKNASSGIVKPDSSKTASDTKAGENDITTHKSDKIPGFVEYNNKELGFKFSYPTEWGTVAVQKEPGFKEYSYDKTTEPTGTFAYSLRFSKAFELVANTYNISLVPVPSGGRSFYGVLGYCNKSGVFSLKKFSTKQTVSGETVAGSAMCSTENLKNTEELSSGKGIFVQNVDVCAEDGCNIGDNVLIADTKSPMYPALVLSGSTLTKDLAQKVLSSLTE